MKWIEQKPHVIVPLEDAAPLFKTASSTHLTEGYVEQVRAADGGIPHRRALDIALFTMAVPHLVLCAVTRPDRCIWRLIGEDVKQRHGFNATGRNYYDFVPEERRENARHAMNMVIDTPCAFRAEILQTHTDGRRRYIEATGFPYLSGEDGVDGFILFADQAIEEMSYHQGEQGDWIGANVVRRDLIDLGFGIDETFVDLVRID